LFFIFEDFNIPVKYIYIFLLVNYFIIIIECYKKKIFFKFYFFFVKNLFISFKLDNVKFFSTSIQINIYKFVISLRRSISIIINPCFFNILLFLSFQYYLINIHHHFINFHNKFIVHFSKHILL
jgi:hypothetical protein